jgi:hypothetical protein
MNQTENQETKFKSCGEPLSNCRAGALAKKA